ncbi:MAG: HTH domain-containing protein [Candidatus Komeilibacteria bacterium]
MARIKVRSGVLSAIAYFKRKIAASKKVIREAAVHISRLKRTDKRVRRLEGQKVARQRSVRRIKPKRQYKGMRGGISVVELAFQILSTRKRPLKIGVLAAKVVARKGAKPGANFVQNLAAALNRDKRFVRVSRGVYSNFE